MLDELENVYTNKVPDTFTTTQIAHIRLISIMLLIFWNQLLKNIDEDISLIQPFIFLESGISQ